MLIGNKTMKNFKILEYLYKQSPMNFYSTYNNYTVIKSTNNAFSLGYRFNKNFTTEELDYIWTIIRVHKRISVVAVFIIFIAFLYEFIFPKFTLFINNSWYVNAFIMLVLLSLVNHITLSTSAKILEKSLLKKFGTFEKVFFNNSDSIDNKYYSLFKSELTKAIIALCIIIFGLTLFSPFEYTQKLVDKHRYKDAIKVATFGAKILPIAPEWYSLRGYANFHLENYNEAILDYDKAYQLGADNFNMMNFDNKIFIKYYLKEYNSAISDFDHEIKNANSEAERDQFLWDKAQFLYNTKKYQDALTLYNDLIIKAENDRIFLLKDRLYLERAQVYKKLKQYELAKLDLETVGIIDFDNFKNPIPKPMLMLDEETFYSY